MIGKNCKNCKFKTTESEVGRYDVFHCERNGFIICSEPERPEHFVCDNHEYKNIKREVNFRRSGE